MAASYTIEPPLVAFQVSGEYTTEDMRETLRQALADARCPDNPLVLVDIRGSLSIQTRSAGEIADTARFVAALSARFGPRQALVVDSDVAYGLMRIAAVHASQGGIDFQVFRELESARKWLLGG